MLADARASSVLANAPDAVMLADAEPGRPLPLPPPLLLLYCFLLFKEEAV